MIGYALMLRDTSGPIGWCLDDNGQICGWCTHARSRDELDTADARYWTSIGYHRLAAHTLRRRQQRRALMGWQP